MSLGPELLAEVPSRFSVKNLQDVFVAVGCGDLTVGQVVHAAERMHAAEQAPSAEDLVTRVSKRDRSKSRSAQTHDDVQIEGVGNLMTTMARCCQPVPGDAVVGYVTRGRGVTIHREDCANVLRWQSEENPRLLQVNWGQPSTVNYSVELLIKAYDRRELFKDISAILSSTDVSITDISSTRDPELDQVSMRLHARVGNFEQLSDLLARLRNVRNVIEARRLRET